MFLNLKVNSYYHLLNSTLSINAIINYSLKHNLSYALLTDPNLSGSYEFYDECQKVNLQPIIGLQLTYNDNFLLFAKSEIGFKNLIKISSFSLTKTPFKLEHYLKNVIIIALTKQLSFEPQFEYYESDYFAIHEVNYLNKDSLLNYEILKAININEKIDLATFKVVNSNYFWDEQKALEHFNINQIKNNLEILTKCKLILPFNASLLPLYKENIDPIIELKNHCEINLMKMNFNSTKLTLYKKRLTYELSVINKLKFNNYFLLVADLVNYAKNNNIGVGPGRGSAPGCLVAFLLNITTIDPIKFDLMFERFLNENRSSPPDIDIDIADVKRELLISYLENKYSENNFCQIIVFQKIKTKMALRDVGRVFDIDLKDINEISKLINSAKEITSPNDLLKSYYLKYPNLFKYAKEILNIPRQFSIHPAGVILSANTLTNYLPLQLGNNNHYLTQLDMKWLETLGWIKIDILGLKNISIIHDTLHFIKLKQNLKIDIDKIPLNDLQVYQEFKKGNTIGIFQLESYGMRKTLMSFKPINISEIALVLSLYRPGASSYIDDYLKVRNGLKKSEWINEETKSILLETNGFCVYQEQIIKLVQIVANWTPNQADIFRRAISKKKYDLIASMELSFIKDSQTNNYSLTQAKEIYTYILKFANYGFNKSHAISYAMISYQMMYLKVNYKLEFMLSLLKHLGSQNLNNNWYLQEVKRMQIPLFPISITKSLGTFRPYQNGIMVGFKFIKGFGNEIVKIILKVIKKTEWNNYFELLLKLSHNKISDQSLEILIKIGSFDEFKIDRNFLLENYLEIIEKYNILDPETNLPLFDLNLNYDVLPMSDTIKKEFELQYLGYYFNAKINSKMFNLFQAKYNLKKINSFQDKIDISFNTLITINKLEIKMSKKQNYYAAISFSQDNLEYEAICFLKTVFSKLITNFSFIVEIKIQNDSYFINELISQIKEK